MTEWDNYWAEKSKIHNKAYDYAAYIYKKYILKQYFKKYINKNFKKGSVLLHAGCGSGQADDIISNDYTIIGIDNSHVALTLYKINNTYSDIIYGDITNTGLQNESIDGIYNLGVMEHFTDEGIQQILIEFRRILKPDGKIILFVPPEYGSTVIFFKIVHFILNDIFNKNIYFQPAEINRIRSLQYTKKLISGTGLKITDFNFEYNDLFTHVAIIIEKN
jgi:SAM-dependent methyltransferase